MECVFRYMPTKKGKHNCNTNIKYGPDVTAPQILLAKPRENQETKNLDKSKKPRNQNFSENVWSEAHVWFFWFSSSFFVFFFVMTLKKLKKLKVFLFFWINWWLKTCEKPKKLRSFLVFCMDCLYMSSKNLSKNQKRPEFFWVFCLTLTKSSFKKPKKKPWVFLAFSRSWPKKNKKTRGKPKKTKHEPQTKHSLKSLVFCFFGFLEV